MKSPCHITYFDFNAIAYSSYFVTGFFENRPDYDYTFEISTAIPAIVKQTCTKKKWRQILSSICVFKFQTGHEVFYFCIDARDSCRADENRGNGFHLPLLERVKYYFKVNYNLPAIQEDNRLSRYKEKILPILPFFGVKCPKLEHRLPRVFPSKSINWTFRDAYRRIKRRGQMPSLDQIRRLRPTPKQYDIFFVLKYYDHPAHSAHNLLRYKIMQAISETAGITSMVGFVSPKEISIKPYNALRLKTFPLMDYLRMLASSRVAIYVRGLHDCVSFKFSQLLMLGLPVVGQRLTNNPDNLMGYPFFEDQFAFDDPDRIVSRATTLIRDRDLRRKIGRSNARTFDARFTPKAVVADVLETIRPLPARPRDHQLIDIEN